MNLNHLLPAAAVLHISEEFVFPGGFINWYKGYRPEIAESITPRFLLIINSVLILVCFTPMFIPDAAYRVAMWLSIAAVLFTNAIFHLQAVYKTKKYSPGTISSLLVYIPLSVYGYWMFLATDQASAGTALSSFLIGASYQWISLSNHRRRSKTE